MVSWVKSRSTASCPSDRPSVTRWYWVKTNEHRIVQFSPSGNAGTLWFVENKFHTLGLVSGELLRGFQTIDVKNVFTFFILVTFFTFFNVFYFFHVFLFSSTVVKEARRGRIFKFHGPVCLRQKTIVTVILTLTVTNFGSQNPVVEFTQINSQKQCL